VHVLCSLGYTDDLVDEAVISSRGRRGRERRLPTVEAGRMILQYLMYKQRVGGCLYIRQTQKGA
jgi:hypothetical protein